MKQLFSITALFICFFFFQIQSNAAVYTWIGPNNGSFSTPANFNPARSVYANTDTIIITGGLGGDTIVATASYVPSSQFFYWQIGTLIVRDGKNITFNCKIDNSIYTNCIEVVGVGGKTIQIDSNSVMNIYGNAYLNNGIFSPNFIIGSRFSPTEARIDGRLTVNTIYAPPISSSSIERRINIVFRESKLLINGVFEVKSDAINLSNVPNSIIYDIVNHKQHAKVILNGDFIFSGGRQTTNFKDSILQVEPTGRVILNFLANATMHNLKGVYKPGSQVVINGHPGSDTALINLPDSIHHLIVNTNGNTNPLHLVARSNINDSLLPILIKGNVTIQKTGSSYLEFNTANNNKSATILGNLTINDGGLQVRNYSNLSTDTGSRVLINGNYLQNGGILNFIGTHPKVGQLLVKGNFYQYNGFIKNNSGSLFPQIVFNGTDTQTLRLRSNIDDSITFVFNNPTGFILDSNLVLGVGSAVDYVNGFISGLGSVVYASPSSLLLFSNPSPTAPSNNLWPTNQGPYQVILQNTAPITLTGSRQIRNSLTVGKGRLNIAPSDSLIIGSVSQAANVFQTGEGYVQGRLSLWVDAQTRTYLFPIGFNGKSKSIELQYTLAPTTGGILSATYANLLPGNLGLPVRQGNDSILNTLGEGYWTINATNGLSSGTYSVKLFGNSISGVTDIQNIRLLKRTNSNTAWLAPGTHGGSIGTVDSFYVSRTGLMGFSDFAFGQKLATIKIGNNSIGSNQSLCQGTLPNTLIGSLPINGTGIYSYLWLQSTTGINGNYVSALGINNAQNYSPGTFLGSVWYKRLIFSGDDVDTSNVVLVQTESKIKVGFTVNKQIQCLRGNQFVFTDTTQGNINRLWVYGNGLTDSSAVLSISFDEGPINTHSVKLYGSLNGNCVDSASQTVVVNSNPTTSAIFGDSVANLNSIKVYEVTATQGSSYHWIFTKGTGNSSSNSIQINWISAGLDQLKVIETANTGCVGDTVSLGVNISQANGISALINAEDLLIYPNPSNGNFRVVSKKDRIKQVQVLNLLGQIMMNEVELLANNNLELNLSQLPEGAYLLKLELENNQTQLHKIFIQKSF